MSTYKVVQVGGGNYAIKNGITGDILNSRFESRYEAEAVCGKLNRQLARSGRKHFGLFGA